MKILRDAQIVSGYLIEDPFASVPTVSHCGEAVCVRGHNLQKHWHSGFEFLVLTRGRASWMIDGRDIFQEIGDVLVVHPRQFHRTGSLPNPENHHLWIGWDLERFSKRGAELAKALRRDGRHLFPCGPELEPLLRGVISQSMTRKPYSAAIVRRYLETITAILLQEVKCGPHITSRSELAPRSLPIQRCVAYMERHLDRRLPLGDLARVAAIQSSSHFCTRFRKEVGIPPAEMHLRLRLNAAKEILASPGDSGVTSVAMQFGFSSSQHFSGKFKQAFGLSPSEWRAGRINRRPERKSLS